MTQKITSAATSLNQLPAVFRALGTILKASAVLEDPQDVLDYGGGKYDQLTRKLAELGVRSLVYDPFNRSADHNALVRQLVETRPSSHGVCSNVLNVIREPASRHVVLENLARWVSADGYVLFTVYEGDKSSKGHKTSKGWQANRPLKNYLREIRKVFPQARYLTAGGKTLIVGKGRRLVPIKAAW